MKKGALYMQTKNIVPLYDWNPVLWHNKKVTFYKLD